MKKHLFLSIILSLIALCSFPAFSQAKSFASEALDAAPGVIDNFVPLSEGDPSKPVGPATGDTNPFRTDLSGSVSKQLPSQFTASQSANPVPLVIRIIRMLLSFLGMGAGIIMIYAGFRWMTAAGNDDQVSEAKKTLRNATIGLILILASWSIVFWVTRRIQVSTGSFGSGGTFSISTDGIEVGPVGTFSQPKK